MELSKSRERFDFEREWKWNLSADIGERQGEWKPKLKADIK